MKKLFTALAVLLLIALNIQAQNIYLSVHGTVTDLSTSQAVPNHAVDVAIDSSYMGAFLYFNTVYTNSNGLYADTIVLPPDYTQGIVDLTTLDYCTGTYVTQTATFNPGNYNLIVDFDICQSGGGCQAGFYAYPDSTSPYTIQFVDNSTGFHDQWNWDFGDGQTSTQSNPLHSYNAGGSFLVCLTIWDSMGTCQDTYCDSIYVSGNPAGGDCENSFTYTSVDSLTYTFIGQINTTDSTIYNWDFGDGTTGFGQTVTHYFQPGGVSGYNVCLSTTSYDSTGQICEDMSCQFIQIFPPPPTGCTNAFTYSSNDLLTYTFVGEAYLNGILVNNNVDYLWDFGDGTTGFGQNATHTFMQANTFYEVCLTTYHWDSIPDSCVAVSCQDVWVASDTINNFTITGTVYLQNQIPADAGEVHLMSFDTLGINQLIIETTTIDSGGYYQFNDVASGAYYIQAELGQNSAYFGQYLPTYHLSSLYWQNANLVVPMPVAVYDIFMLPDSTLAGGIGGIYGIVENESLRNLMSDVEILLLGPGNEAYTYRRTNVNGEYSFADIAFGTYQVYTEIPGIETYPVTVTLVESNPIQQVNIIIKDGMALLGIEDQTSTLITEIGNIYPNPVSNDAYLNVSLKETVQLEVNIMNLVGQRVMHQELILQEGNQKIHLQIAGIPPGLYHLQIISSTGEKISRKLIKY
ncbi:MAG: PKD domain-containing protein [Bacteroidota bacterium]|nr:PKD domain-containing protein [Bacteroidota bacterium]